MSFKSFFRKLIFPNTYNSEAYIAFLRRYHIDVGEGCIIYSPNNTHIDIQRPHCLHIGNYVKITNGVNILTHDYSRSVLCNMEEYGNVGDFGYTWIGDNVFIGTNAIILMGSHIGNNTIVGAGAVVTGSYPDNSVIAGNPAKVICTIEDYYRKKKENEVSSAKEYVIRWREKYGRNPTVKEMTNAFSWIYLARTKETILTYPELFNLNGVDREKYIDMFLKSKPVYLSFEDFLKDC